MTPKHPANKARPDDRDRNDRKVPHAPSYPGGNVYSITPAPDQARTLPMGGSSAGGSGRLNDTIVMSEPYAFQANAAIELAASLELPPRDESAEVAPAPDSHPATVLAQETPSLGRRSESPSKGGAARAPFFDVMKLNKAIVSSYKLMGFAILGAILFGLASFIATNLFYIFNESWVTPMELSSTDPRVLQLTAQYSAQKAARDAVATQRLELSARLSDAQRIAVSEGSFQRAFDEAMKADLADRSGELASLRNLIADLRHTRRHVTAANREYTGISKDTLKQEFAAGLIDKDARVKGGYELAEIASANLALHEKDVEIDARVTDLKRQVASLESAGTHGGGGMTYEVLHMQHEYEQSLLASQKAEDDAGAITKSLAMLDQTLAEYDAQLARIARAPYAMAADKSVNTAFVPYDNVGAVEVGDKVYGCAASFLWCHPVGTVAEVLDGEIIGKHPLHNRDLRGVIVRLALSDPKAIAKPVLHLRHAPLGI